MSVGLQRLRDEPDVIREGAVRKGEDPALVDRALEVDAERRRILGENEALKAERNAASKRIGEAIKAGRRAGRPGGRRPADGQSTAAGERIKALDASLAEAEAELDDLLLRIPNPPDPDIPVGGEEANVTIRIWGEQLPRDQPLIGEVGADAPAGGPTWTRKPHWELGEALGIIDNARGAKIAGSGFPVYKGAGSALQRGLINWFLDVHTRENGLTEVWPPAVVNTDIGARDRPDPRQGRPDVRRHPRRPVPGPDRRGPGHEPASRRDPRGRRAARSATRRIRHASAARPAQRARTHGASCASTSSTRSRWSCSSAPRSPTMPSNG